MVRIRWFGQFLPYKVAGSIQSVPVLLLCISCLTRHRNPTDTTQEQIALQTAVKCVYNLPYVYLYDDAVSTAYVIEWNEIRRGNYV